jgi:dihydropteroate synthase
MHRTKEPRKTVGVGDRTLGPDPVLVGVLNVTPDSFSDSGDFFDPERAASRAATMLDEGAQIVDVGGESTRPGSDPVPPDEEVRRVVPVIRTIRASRPDAILSIDTYRATTAEAALEAGASIVNDVTALRGDPRMSGVVAEARCPVILMHMLGEPKTMQHDPSYGDVVRDVRDFLAARAERAVAAGVDNIILDPGIGFGKTLEHNLALLRDLASLVELGFPLLVGVSRKRFIGRISGVDEPKDRVFGTVAANVVAYQNGATFFRVHDVRANREALSVAQAILRGSPRR